MTLRARLADLLRSDDGMCVDCGDRRGSTWVRSWRMHVARPWTFAVPELERRCYDCWLDRETGSSASP